ncbi:MAG: CoA-binding domain protein [Deltaproteobacteria bacterium]|nr:CoA-binding domain protein [Deltaproteobacteria bacterium]
MQKFFFPTSIAIFGVSAAPGNMGIGILKNLERFSFKGNVFLIGEKGGSVRGKKIVRSIDEIESIPDIAIFIIPAKAIPGKLEECGKKGVRFAVIESGGFSEFGEEKETLENEIVNIARKWDIKVLGPNCLGTMNLENGLMLPFVPFYKSFMKKGNVSIISQSGGLLHDILLLLSWSNVGANKLVSAGNKLMLNECDFLEYFISDPDTGAIGLYLEDIKDGRRLARLAASTDKPVVMLKANEGAGAAHIAQFHTASLAGDDLLAAVLLRRAGIHRVYSLDEMVNAVKIFSLPLLGGRRLAVIARSGGHAVIASDAVYRHGFRLAKLSQDIFDLLGQKKKADVIRATNPIDLGDIFDIEFHYAVLERTLRDDEVDGALFIHSYDAETEGDATVALINKINVLVKNQSKPVVFCMLSEKEQWFGMNDMASFPVFSEAEQAIKALALSWDHFRKIENRKAAGVPLRKHEKDGKVSSKKETSFMAPHRAFTLLRQYDLPVAEFAIATNFEECREAAHHLGYPVALKSASPNTLHKTEKGGVRLNLSSDISLKEAFTGIETETYMVQRMAPSGHELIIGAKWDPAFGQVLIFGMGGIFAELLKDISVRMTPIGEEAAAEMINEIQGAAILNGFRGMPPCDLQAVARCIARVSRLLDDHPEIVNLDINPLVALEKGRGCIIVDAKIETSVPPAQ